MIFMSIFFGLIALMVGPFVVQDWWKPMTITNTAVGFEDFLFGFMTGGILAVIYEVIFKTRMKKKGGRTVGKNINLFFLVLLYFVLFFGSFFILKLNTFVSFLIATVAEILVVYIKRKDL